MLRKDIERGSYYIVKPETPCRFLVQVIDWDTKEVGDAEESILVK